VTFAEGTRFRELGDNDKSWPSATPILKRKRRDFLHKLSNYYATEYDLVAVEGLDAKELVELPGNSRNRAGAAWGTFLRMLEYKCEREGTHFAEVDPRNTTKACASCGVKTDKPLWVREHSVSLVWV